jgi:uncharacterized protein
MRVHAEEAWFVRRSIGAAIGLVLLAAACDSRRTPAAPDPVGGPTPGSQPAARVLMVTTTAGFRHDSIPVAQQVMTTLAMSTREFTVATTEQLTSLEAASLSGYDVLFFALTSGELPLSDAQKSAVIDFVERGGGFLGVHSATDTLYDWPAYGRLVGAYFREHPWTQEANVIVEDSTHPATAGLGTGFRLNEEFYTFRDNPRSRVQVLLRLDAASVGTTGDYPLAWAHAVGAGRAYYNALGHFSSTWTDQRFQRQLTGAIRWLARR